MASRRWATAALLLLGCTARNPGYQPPDDFGASARDLAAPSGRDLATAPPDLGRADLTFIPPDLLMSGGPCTVGERACAASGGASEGCVNGVLLEDRNCPGTSHCAGGYCQPPSAGLGSLGRACDGGGGPSETACVPTTANDPSCQPFVTDAATGAVAWFCAKPAGAGGPGSACTKNKQCRSGFCGSNGTCFRACQNTCPVVGGPPLRCATVTIVVEGVSVDADSCIP